MNSITMKAKYPILLLVQQTLLFTSLGAVVLGWFWSLSPWLAGKTQAEVFPAGIPWLKSEADCVKTGRVWHQQVCWDQEHDMTF
jgi:hypothetical protein